jgi:hypothetical protein
VGGMWFSCPFGTRIGWIRSPRVGDSGRDVGARLAYGIELQFLCACSLNTATGDMLVQSCMVSVSE